MFIALGVLFGLSLATGLLLIVLAPREAGRAETIQCIDNLKRLTTAARNYAADHEDRLPPVAAPTTLAQAEGAVVTYPPDAVKSWPKGDWRRLLLPYVTTPGAYLCPVRRSAFSYEFDSRPEGVGLAFVGDKLGYALVWDVGLCDRPGAGPHHGKYAVNTLGGMGMATNGRDEPYRALRFRP